MNNTHNFRLKAILAGTGLLCCAAPVSASFIGDTMLWAATNTNDPPSLEGSGSLTPDPTDTDTYSFSNSERYIVSADGTDSSFKFEWNSSSNGSGDRSVPDLTIEITDIDWLPDPGTITGASGIDGSGFREHLYRIRRNRHTHTGARYIARANDWAFWSGRLSATTKGSQTAIRRHDRRAVDQKGPPYVHVVCTIKSWSPWIASRSL